MNNINYNNFNSNNLIIKAPKTNTKGLGSTLKVYYKHDDESTSFRTQTPKMIQAFELGVDKRDDGSVGYSFNISFRGDEEGTKIGNPNVKGVSVNAKILTHAREKKVLIYKKKRRKGYQRKNGHRQWYSEIEINDIKVDSTKKSSAKSKIKVTTKAKTVKKETKKTKE